MEAAILIAIATTLVTLGIALVGWHFVARANSTSAEALEIAKAADQRAARLERISVEKRDVVWEAKFDPGRNGTEALLHITNVGTDSAGEVEVAVDPDLDISRITETAGSVAPTERVSVNLDGLAEEGRDLWLSRTRDTGHVRIPDLNMRIRITWSSASGVAAVQVIDRVTFSPSTSAVIPTA